jgi:FkbM family methyltransferase
MAEHHIRYNEVILKVISNSVLEENFWNLFAAGKWEPEYLFFMVNNRKGKVFLDIGSWIGPVTLLMSKHYDEVLSVDFDPVAIKSFMNNLSLNSISNVTLYELGLSDKTGIIRVGSEALGSSMTSLYTKPLSNSVEVKVIRFDEFVAKLKNKDSIGFIKIDCEGAEYKFLDQIYAFLRKQSVRVLISYHPFVLKKPYYYFIKLYHWLRQLQFTRYYFSTQHGVIVKKPFQPVFKLADNFPMADVIES